VLGPGWEACSSTAIEAVRYLPDRGILQVLFVEGQMTYDYLCADALYEQFEYAPSRGRFINDVLKPYAQQLGWSVTPYRWAA
jgi:hypothetical protein